MWADGRKIENKKGGVMCLGYAVSNENKFLEASLERAADKMDRGAEDYHL